MIDRGTRLRYLGTEELTWGDLNAIVACARPPESAIWRARNPKEWQWQLPEQLLASIADSLHWLQWAKTPDGQKNRNQPEPIQRPGVKSKRKTYGTRAMPIDKLRKFLGWGVE